MPGGRVFVPGEARVEGLIKNFMQPGTSLLDLRLPSRAYARRRPWCFAWVMYPKEAEHV
jgi:hypothetical protein